MSRKQRGRRGNRPTLVHVLLPDPDSENLSAMSRTECPLCSAKMYHVHDRRLPIFRFPVEMTPPPNTVDVSFPLGFATR